MTSNERTQGKVIETLPNLQFKVEFASATIICYMSGKMRKNKIKVLIGDRVEAVLSTTGDRGRITKRL